MNTDINWDFVTEEVVWEEDNRIWNESMKIVSKDDMEEDAEYTIF